VIKVAHSMGREGVPASFFACFIKERKIDKVTIELKEWRLFAVGQAASLSLPPRTSRPAGPVIPYHLVISPRKSL